MKRLPRRPKKKQRPEGVKPTFSAEPLDPWLACGPDTSVQELWRVRERLGKQSTFHLVFFDRYGWYCEHGRGCRAVAEAKRVVREMSAVAPRPKTTQKKRARK